MIERETITRARRKILVVGDLKDLLSELLSIEDVNYSTQVKLNLPVDMRDGPLLTVEIIKMKIT